MCNVIVYIAMPLKMPKVDCLACEVSDTTSTLSVSLFLDLGWSFDAYDSKHKIINMYM